MYVPTSQPTPSARALDLGQRVATTVRTYLAEDPETSPTEVAQALVVARNLLAHELGSSRRALALTAVALTGLAVFGLFLFLYLSGGGSPQLPVITVAVVVFGIAAVVLVVATRGI